VIANDIDEHRLLNEDERDLCRAFRQKAGRDRPEFTFLKFAEICLRVAGRDYHQGDMAAEELAQHDLEHRRAAVRYVYELLRASTDPTVTEGPDRDVVLEMLEYLYSNGM
jgi:hypothetical protein